MTLPRIKLIWGGAKQAPGHWRLGLWGVFERQVGSRPRVAVSVRGALAWLLGVALAGYLAAATALYVWFERNPYNLVTWSDTLLLPLRWDEVRVLRGRMIIAEGLEDLRAKRWGEAHMKLRVGVARAPAELRARLALAEFYTMANQRPAAIELLRDGLAHGYPGRQYLTTLFALAAQSEDFDTIVDACGRLQATDEAERAWLAGQHVSALIAAKRPEEALELAAGPGGGSAQMREGRVLALVEAGRPAEAIADLAAWRAETGAANRAQILRLEARAFREAGRLDEMEAALDEVRALAPADPRGYVYGVVQRALAGRTAAAEVALDDYFRRFAGTAQNLLLAATALTEAKAAPLVARCTAEAAAHGFPVKPFQLTLALAQLEAGDWAGAVATLGQVKPQVEASNLAEQFSFEWMTRLAAVATQSDAAPESALLTSLQQRTLPLRVYRQTAEVLLRAGRPAAAKNVVEIGARPYPVSRTLARLRAEAEAAQVAVSVPAAPAESTPATVAVATESEFFADLARWEAEKKWNDAARAIRRMRVAKPAWLARREADVFDAQMRVAIQTADTLELLGAAKLYLNGDRERAERVLVLARELGESGRKVDGERLIAEVLRKNADYPPALRLRKEWEAAAVEKAK